MTIKRIIKSVIKIEKESLSVAIEEDISQVLGEIKNALKRLPLINSVKQEQIDKWENEIYKILFKFDRSVKNLTDRQRYNFLEKLDKSLKNLEAKILNLPFEMKELLIESDLLNDTYFQLFPNDHSISKSRCLIGMAKNKSDYLKKMQNDIIKNNKGEAVVSKSERGKKENLYNNYVSERLALIYNNLTGKNPGREFDAVKEVQKGAYFYFVKDIFRIGNITASIEDQVRKSSKRFRENYVELIEEK